MVRFRAGLCHCAAWRQWADGAAEHRVERLLYFCPPDQWPEPTLHGSQGRERWSAGRLGWLEKNPVNGRLLRFQRWSRLRLQSELVMVQSSVIGKRRFIIQDGKKRLQIF